MQPPAATASASSVGLTSSDARQLAERISDTQTRYNVAAIRLLASGSCGVIVTDNLTGQEHVIDAPEGWQRLRAN